MDLYQLLRFLHVIGFIFLGGGFLAVFVSEWRGYPRACQQQPDAWDLHQPPAEICLTRVCAKATVIFEDLFLYHGKLRRQHLQAKARFSWHTRISRICDYVGSERWQENRVARIAQNGGVAHISSLPITPAKSFPDLAPFENVPALS
jgi:hypothetical protein